MKVWPQLADPGQRMKWNGRSIRILAIRWRYRLDPNEIEYRDADNPRHEWDMEPDLPPVPGANGKPIHSIWHLRILTRKRSFDIYAVGLGRCGHYPSVLVTRDRSVGIYSDAHLGFPGRDRLYPAFVRIDPMSSNDWAAIKFAKRCARARGSAALIVDPDITQLAWNDSTISIPLLQRNARRFLFTLLKEQCIHEGSAQEFLFQDVLSRHNRNHPRTEIVDRKFLGGVFKQLRSQFKALFQCTGKGVYRFIPAVRSSISLKYPR